MSSSTGYTRQSHSFIKLKSNTFAKLLNHLVLLFPTESQSANNNSRYRARLCHLKKWQTFDGYGFYLQSEEGVRGIFIGKVDPDSPAEAAGLRRNDRIIEVNGANVESDTQNELVEKVVAVPQETRMLVVDRETYDHFLESGVLINGNMTDVDIIEAPDT